MPLMRRGSGYPGNHTLIHTADGSYFFVKTIISKNGWLAGY